MLATNDNLKGLRERDESCEQVLSYTNVMNVKKNIELIFQSLSQQKNTIKSFPDYREHFIRMNMENAAGWSDAVLTDAIKKMENPF
jgi:hypothetical protein